MSAQEYNTIRQTPVSKLGQIPAWQFAAFLIRCPIQTRERLMQARLQG